MKVGIDVVTGFLGAGKSAFINSLINKTIADKEKIVVVTCESGKTQINEFNENGQSVKHISFMGDSLGLNNEIYEIVKKYKPHRIIIEYNGTDTLENLYKCVFDNETGKLIKLSTIYFVCDGRNIEFYVMNMGEILLPFIQNSDVIVINNYNIEKSLELEKGIKLLESLNHKAQIIKAESNNGFNLALENSKLLEEKLVRNMRVKLIEYMRK
ncbi:GTP-binding protein [Clostridium cuniculi]|uniref:GTP-binding protein n=1 Tax=Clostridium cuniculi TaxID=2548455 RepID=UPI001055EF05|nr:GTP-binding protein [Clostridium cuniculi]